jgi:hypothetical protein
MTLRRFGTGPVHFNMGADLLARDLVQIVERLVDPQPNITEEELDQLTEEFLASIPHPAGTDLIYYPEQWGLPGNVTADAIVCEALSWMPRIVACRVTYVRPHPRRNDICCIGVEVPNSIHTQVVSAKTYRVGEVCAVALSGVRLLSGRVIGHGFVDKVYSAGEILNTTDNGVGTEFPVSDFPNC